MQKDLEKTLLKRYEESKALEKKKKKEIKKEQAAALIGALTVSLHTLFLFSLTFPTARTQHVVFEEALSHIHVVVPVNISGLLKSVTDFGSKILVLKTNYADTAVYTKRL